MKKKKLIIIAILCLAIGFATVTTTLIINGTSTISGNTEDFINNVIFTKSSIDDGESEISEDGRTITFTSKTLTKVNEKNDLYFTVSNKSKQYGANAKINCNFNEDVDDYLTYKLDKSTFTLNPGQNEEGTLTIELINTPITNLEISLTCTIDATAIEVGNDANIKTTDVYGYSTFSWYEALMNDYYADIVDNFLYQNNITNLYQSFNFEKSDMEIVKKFINRLASNGISTYYLIGDPSFYNDLDTLKEEVDRIENYNNSLTSTDTKLEGIVLDIEPYGSSTYNSDKSTGFKAYVTTIIGLSEYAHSKGLKIINSIPAWYDEYETSGDLDDETSAQVPNLLFQLMKAVDKTSIMAFRKDATIESIKNEVQIAKNNNFQLESISEFGRDAENDMLSYWSDSHPIEKALTNWNLTSKYFNYNNLGFSYHYLDVVIELNTNHKYTNNIVKVVDSDGNSLITGSAIINKGTNYIYTNYYGGKFRYIDNSTDTPDISIKDYKIKSLNKDSCTNYQCTYTLTVETPVIYFAEIYPTIYEDGEYHNISSGTVSYRTSFDTSWTQEEVWSNEQFPIRQLITETPYEFKLEYNEKNYELTGATVKVNGESISVLKDGYVYIPADLDENKYIGISLQMKEIEE